MPSESRDCTCGGTTLPDTHTVSCPASLYQAGIQRGRSEVLDEAADAFGLLSWRCLDHGGEEVARIRSIIYSVRSRTMPPLWTDKPDEWTESIEAAFPTRSGSHDEYGVAMQMVGHRHSKGELVRLVNWLLVRLRNAESAKLP